jgi:hypothetical protein
MVDYSNIQINLISKDTFEKMTSSERLQFIINEVKQGKVLILEQGLTAAEQFELNKLTMSEIDHESFVGIEMPGFSTETKKPGLFDRLFRRRSAPRMMAIGPARLMRIIKKEPSLIQTVVMPISGIMSEEAEGEGIPLDEIDTERGDETGEDVPDSQLRLEEFSRNSEESSETAGTREELERLIGPELREDTPEDRSGEADSPPEPASEEGDTDLREESDGEDKLVPSEKAQGIGEPIPTGPIKGEGKGYVYRKIKEEGEED